MWLFLSKLIFNLKQKVQNKFLQNCSQNEAIGFLVLESQWL